MIRFFLFFVLSLCASSCIGKYKSESTQSAKISEQVKSTLAISGDTLNLSLANSKIYWKGTKMLGAGKHEGEIALKDGYFLIEDGQFIVDMVSIQVTDIPKSDPIPRENIVNT